jgi:glycosyltransferase involved in cell wall biosynthesis
MSLAEGMPRTVLEALACKTSVVTTDLEQLRPLFKDVGRLVPSESPPELADALGDLLEASPKTREAWVRRAREDSEQLLLERHCTADNGCLPGTRGQKRLRAEPTHSQQ